MNDCGVSLQLNIKSILEKKINARLFSYLLQTFSWFLKFSQYNWGTLFQNREIWMTDIYELFMPSEKSDVYDKLYLTIHYCVRVTERYRETTVDGEYRGVLESAKQFVKSFRRWKAKQIPWAEWYAFFLIDKYKYKHIFFRRYGRLSLVTVYHPLHENYDLTQNLVLQPDYIIPC